MNLLQFLKKVDDEAALMTKEQLSSFIHEQARLLPENERDRFIELLSRMRLSDTKEIRQSGISSYGELQVQIASLRLELKRIEDEELCLIGDINEEYDEWYNSSVSEFIFRDPEHIASVIDKGIVLVHRCVDCEAFFEGLRLAEALLAMDIQVGGDYDDYGDGRLSLEELWNEELLHEDYDEFILDALYAAYRATAMESRPEVMYRLFGQSSRNISMNRLLQYANEELENVGEFLKLWLHFLCGVSAVRSKKLLEEAQTLMDDFDFLRGEAKGAARLHPELYLNLLEKCENENNIDIGLEIGMEALENPKLAGQCWLEAFRSETNIVNYLRLIFEGEKCSALLSAAGAWYEELFGQSKEKVSAHYALEYSEPEKNSLYPDQYYALKFFDGEFFTVLTEGMNESYALGWSSTFMKQGIALFILLLWNKDILDSGCKAMLNMAVNGLDFKAEAYARGLHWESVPESGDLFWNSFCRWKKNFLLTEAEKSFILQKLDSFVKLRVEGIMAKSNTKYYWECAAFIAALGEAREAVNGSGKKAALMSEYKNAYSRRTAFHRELRSFGMK